MTKKYVITDKELDRLEEARLQLLNLVDENSPLSKQMLSLTQGVRITLWQVVNRRREEVVDEN